MTPQRIADRKVPDFVDRLQAEGRYTFTRTDVRETLGQWNAAIRGALRRLDKVGRIVRPREGFYVIVPLEYLSAGSPPATWFVHDLMTYLARPYYVGLLSASALYGAAHQKPQEFQVVTDRPTRGITMPRVRVRFVVSSRAGETPTKEMKTATGFIRVSTPEATALDLVHFPSAAGHLNNIATVLLEMAEQLDPRELRRLSETAPSVEVRRLGFLLDLVGAEDVANPLRTFSRDRPPKPLDPGAPQRGSRRNDRWMLYINTTVEPDEI